MPTYTVQLNVNVPGLGDRNVVQAGIAAPSITAAIDVAKAGITVEVLQVQKTGA